MNFPPLPQIESEQKTERLEMLEKVGCRLTLFFVMIKIN